MKKILVLTTTYPRWPGDTEPAFVHSLNRELISENEVHVLAPHTAGALRDEVMDGIHIHRFRYLPESWQKLAYDGGVMPNIRRNRWLLLQVPLVFFFMLVHALRLIRRHKVDILYAHWIVPQGLLALIASRMSSRRLPVLVTSHGTDLFGLDTPFFRTVKRYVINRVDAVTVVSQAMAVFCRDELKATKQPAVMPMGIDCRRLFVENPDPVSRKGVLFVGRLVEGKGVEHLLQAYAEFAAEYPDETLTIVGDGLTTRSLQQHISRLGLESQVRMTGGLRQQQVAELMRNARLCVVPSQREGLGIVIAEALACGTPVVVSALDTIQDVHDDAQLQFAYGNIGQMREAMLFVYRHPDAAQKKTARLRQRILQQFDWQNVGQGYRDLIAKL